jgi:hypothetical protein
MIAKLKSELVTARNCVEKYAYLCWLTGEKLYKDLCDFAAETQTEYQGVLTQIEKQILV